MTRSAALKNRAGPPLTGTGVLRPRAVHHTSWDSLGVRGGHRRGRPVIAAVTLDVLASKLRAAPALRRGGRGNPRRTFEVLGPPGPQCETVRRFVRMWLQPVCGSLPLAGQRARTLGDCLLHDLGREDWPSDGDRRCRAPPPS